MEKPSFPPLLKQKLLNLLNRVNGVFDKIKKYPYQKRIKSLKKQKINRIFLRYYRKITSSWRLFCSCFAGFLFIYYILGGLIVDDTSVTFVYPQAKEKNQKSEMVNAMAFLINREIDHKMWTPNLPFIFPAYILDNTPNFQIGVIYSVRDITGLLKNFSGPNAAQKKNLKKAYEYLQYSPYIWLLSQTGSFSIAPSANAQYRKARNELLQYNKEGVFPISALEFEKYLAKINQSLQVLCSRNDNQITEHSDDWFDFSADDVFYRAKGFAFGYWQIAEAVGVDYKAVILQYNVYTEWTHLLASLRKTAEFQPLIVRNANPESSFAPNHLAVQNYYLKRAQAAALQILAKIRRENARQN